MSIRSFKILLSAALAVLVACERPAKPATVVPDAPAILSFTASQSSVTAGTEVTLTWKVEHASSITLMDAAGNAVAGVAENAFDSSTKVTVNETTVYVLTARGEAGSDTRVVNVDVPGTATTVLFRALPSEILGGDATTLVWSAPGYGTVSITDDSNAAVDLRGQTESGSVEVTPSKTTTYTLKAGDKTLTASVTVNASVLSFTSSSQAAQPGEMVTLSWATAGATKVTLASAGRGDLSTTTTASDVASGSFVDTIPATTPNNGVVTYTLTVEGGNSTLSRVLTVYVATGIQINSFIVPKLAKAGSAVNVTWQTVAADSVELSVDGATIYLSPTPSDAKSGNFSLTAPGSNFALTLKATNARGGVDIVTRAVDVVVAPTSATLTANPTTVAVGQKTTLSWASPNARRVRIVTADGETVGSASGTFAESGSVDAYPSASTTYTVIADDTLGDPAVTGTAQVTVTGNAPTFDLFPRGTAVSGAPITLSYSADPSALIYGLPHTNVLTGTTSGFIDIKDTGTLLQFGSAADNEVSTFDPGFETYLYGQRAGGPVTVSTNGWLSFGTETNSRSVNYAFPTANAAPFMVGPFWDDLRMRDTAGIYWQVVGTAPEQKLIVQWDDVQVGSDTATALTFQAQVLQHGTVSFHYKTVTLASGYTSYNLGVQGPGSTFGLNVTATPASNTSIILFSPVSLPTTLTAVKGTTFSGFAKTGTGYLRLTSAVPPTISLNDIRVTEVSFAPHPSLPQGQWVELFNSSSTPVVLTDWALVSSTGTRFTFDAGTIPPASTLLVGASTNGADNDDAGVSIDWDALSVDAVAGSLALSYAPDASVTLGWDAGVGAGLTGTSVMADPNTYLTTAGATRVSYSCLSTKPYGSQTPQQKGTPGSVASCFFGYTMEPIAGSYFDIQDAGTPIMNLTAGVDGKTVPITMPTANPLPLYFGVRYPIVSMSNDGWMKLATTGVTETDFTNEAYPDDTDTPNGVCAPFWDDAYSVPGKGEMHWKRIAAGEDPANPAPHYIFQWTNSNPYTSAARTDNWNYQVKWFDDGVIEFHYGAMIGAVEPDYAKGSSATVWLENAGVALPVQVNEGLIQPNSGYRFTPR